MGTKASKSSEIKSNSTQKKKQLTLYLLNIDKREGLMTMKFIVDVDPDKYERSTDVMLQILKLLIKTKGDKTKQKLLWNEVREGRLEPKTEEEGEKTPKTRVFAFMDTSYYIHEPTGHHTDNTKPWEIITKRLKETFTENAEVHSYFFTENYKDAEILLNDYGKWQNYVQSDTKDKIIEELKENKGKASKKNKGKAWKKYAATAAGVGLTAAGIYGLHKTYKGYKNRKKE